MMVCLQWLEMAQVILHHLCKGTGLENQSYYKYFLYLGFVLMVLVISLGVLYVPNSKGNYGFNQQQTEREKRISVLRKEITESIVEDQMKLRVRNSFDLRNMPFEDPKDKATKLEYILEQSHKHGTILMRQKELYGVTELDAPESVAKAKSTQSDFSIKVNALSESIKNVTQKE